MADSRPWEGERMGARSERRRGARWSPVLAAVGFCTAVLLLPCDFAGASAAQRPVIDVRAAIVIDADTGQVLYARAPEVPLPIASTTKIMTALVTLEHAALAKVLSAPGYASGPAESRLGLRRGERMSVHDLLLALLLPSANDAAHDLAVSLGHGSVRRFVALMNARASSLGLRHTHYSTPVGLDTPGNHSSARDLAMLAAYAERSQPYFARVVALARATLRSGDHVRVVVNRNTLVGAVPWIDGVKTGHTLAAGDVLVASGRRGGMHLVSAVLGARGESDRDAATLAVLRYAGAAWRPVTALRDGALVGRLPVSDRPGFRANLIAGGTLRAIVPRDARVSVRLELRHRELTGPLPRHTIVGRAVALASGRPVASIPVLLARALPAVSALAIASRRLLSAPVLLPLAAVAALGAVAARRRRALGRRARERDDERARRRAERTELAALAENGAPPAEAARS